MKRPVLMLIPMAVLALGLTLFARNAWATAAQTTGFQAWDTGKLFKAMNGEHILRARLTPDNSTAEDNTTAAGSGQSIAALTYTFFGGERVCFEAVTVDAYVEIIAAASMAASGGKGRLVKADLSGDIVCDTLSPDGAKKVSALCTAAGPCLVKVFEVKYP